MPSSAMNATNVMAQRKNQQLMSASKDGRKPIPMHTAYNSHGGGHTKGAHSTAFQSSMR